MSAEDPLIGRILDGRWQIEEPLGRGGMGHVYRGRQLSVDRVVAIKVIRPKLVLSEDYTKRFIREGRLATKLNHPNLVTVYDFGETSDGILYLAMEFLSGVILSDWLAGNPPLNARITAAMEILDGLGAAHDKDIIHRDLKPGNIMLVNEPTVRVKVLDFGLAKSMTTDRSVTGAGIFVGTLHYASPEQCRADKLDGRSDLYGFGCVLYLMLAGRLPFEGLNPQKVRLDQLKSPAPPLNNLKLGGVTDAIKSVVYRLLEKCPDDRYQTAAETKAALSAAAPVTSTPPGSQFIDDSETEEMAAGALVALREAIAKMNAESDPDSDTAIIEKSRLPRMPTPLPARLDTTEDHDPNEDTISVDTTTPMVPSATQNTPESATLDVTPRAQKSTGGPNISLPTTVSLTARKRDDHPIESDSPPRITSVEATENDPGDISMGSEIFGPGGVDSEAVTTVRNKETRPMDTKIVGSSTLTRGTVLGSVAVAIIVAILAGWLLGRSRNATGPAPKPAVPVVHHLGDTPDLEASPAPRREERPPGIPKVPAIENTAYRAATASRADSGSDAAPSVSPSRASPPAPSVAHHLITGAAAFKKRDCLRATDAYTAFLDSTSPMDPRRPQAQTRVRFCQRMLKSQEALLKEANSAYNDLNCREALPKYQAFLKHTHQGDLRIAKLKTRIAYCLKRR